jgi:hypothetical protein
MGLDARGNFLIAGIALLPLASVRRQARDREADPQSRFSCRRPWRSHKTRSWQNRAPNPLSQADVNILLRKVRTIESQS